VRGTWLRLALPLADPHVLVRLLWVALCALFVSSRSASASSSSRCPPALGVWFIYRIARGWLRLMDGRPAYD
jgi:uncharacterized membrane protein